MKKEVRLLLILLFCFPFVSCSYNPFISNNHTTGSPMAAVFGTGVGAGAIATYGGSKPLIAMGGVAGGMFGYYVTTLRFDSGPILARGGQVYQVGDLVGIYIPTDNFFEPNTAELLPQARPVLDSVATVLQRFPNNNIIISGNTSGFAQTRWEASLSERRAQVVSAYLWNSGINQFKTQTIEMRKLNYVGYGDYFPVAQKITNDGLRANSRIQIVSYPTDCDLHIDEKHITLHNIGALTDPPTRAPTVNRCVRDRASGEYSNACFTGEFKDD